ncbi:Protein_phosphatase 2A regulatory subunit [Hexamita inflata]|uniref:Putative n=1 Tax=Hexamita inflata TaxID=28002 RepID=A0ABP1GVV0_9EUKA
MDKTPTFKKQMSPLPPSPLDVIQQAHKQSEQNKEYIGQVIANTLSSPMLMKSPALQQKMSEYLENIIDPTDFQELSSFDLVETAPLTIKISTPTLKKTPNLQSPSPEQISVLPKSPTMEVQQQIEESVESIFIQQQDRITTKASGEDFVSSAIFQSTEKELSREAINEILNLNFIEKAKEIVEDLPDKLSDLLNLRVNKKCVDFYRCKKLKKPASQYCSSCSRREFMEAKIINFLDKHFKNEPIKMFEMVSEDGLKLLDQELFDIINERRVEIAQEFSCSTQEHWLTVAQNIYGQTSAIGEHIQKTESVLRERVELPPLSPSTKIQPFFILFQLVCECLFNVPGYIGFSLIPIIQSRFKHMHPGYANNLTSIISVSKTREQLKQFQFDFSTQNNINVTVSQIKEFYMQYIQTRDSTQRFINCLKSIDPMAKLDPHNCDSLLQNLNNDDEPLDFDDIFILMGTICKFHPGLEFLRATPDFQISYSETAVTRIFLENDRCFSNKLNKKQVIKSDILSEFWQLQRSADLNKFLRYFSYEHFYVIFCQFWQLDTDHDQYISEDELTTYGQITSQYTSKCICSGGKNCKCSLVYNKLVTERIFQQIPRPFYSKVEGKMSYKDFICFILCEENKDSDYSLEYFFRILDVDGDGVISRQDYLYFWPQMVQLYKTHFRDVMANRFDDLFCQLIDAAHHTQAAVGLNEDDEYEITLQDIRRSKLPGNFINPFVNVVRAIQFDVKDPYSIKYPSNQLAKNSWDRFAKMMYDLMEDGDSGSGAEAGELDGGVLCD